jgi:hypothetical protein
MGIDKSVIFTDFCIERNRCPAGSQPGSAGRQVTLGSKRQRCVRVLNLSDFDEHIRTRLRFARPWLPAHQLAAEVALQPQLRRWSVRASLPLEPDVVLRSTSFQPEGENHNEVPDDAGRNKIEAFRRTTSGSSGSSSLCQPKCDRRPAREQQGIGVPER